MDFYEAIKPRSTEITIAGESRRVERARLGRFFRLSEAYRKYREALDGQNSRAIDYLFGYLALSSGISKEQWGSCSPLELADGFLCLVQLNNVQLDLPLFSGVPEREEKVYDYRGRFIATWVTRLARMYGWTAQYILESLFPEEAVCYLQEVEIQDFNEREFAYSLSELAYRYDKGTKTSRYVPLKKPGWMVAKKREAEVEEPKIPAAFIPQGIVIDLGEAYRQRKSRPDRGSGD